MIHFDACYLPETGGTSGLEIVYDFQHQERGLFGFAGPTSSPLTAGGLGGGLYVGKTRGFSNIFNANNYEAGVDLYSGGFKSTSINLNPFFLKAGPSIINAEPLDEYNQVNPNGVFASYYGIGAGPSLALPINVDIAVTNYVLEDRQRYLLGQVPNPNDEQAVFNKKTDIIHRKRVAREIGEELRWWGVALPPIVMTPILEQALRDVQYFADKPTTYVPSIIKE